MNIPFFSLSEQTQALKKEILEAVEKTLDNTSFCLGPDVEAFEDAFAELCESSFALGVNSGTSALHLAAHALDIHAGHEVIVPAYTFASTAWTASYVGAIPVFVDIDNETFNLNPELIEQAITPRTKAIVPVHLYGHACDMDPILAIAKKNDLVVIEDAAQAHCARYKNKPIGQESACTTFSFYPSKNLSSCGEGGALITHDKTLYNRIKALRVHGSHIRYIHDEVGYNYRMEGIQGAILNVKIKHIEAWTNRRRHLAKLYTEGLKDTPLQLPVEKDYAYHVYHQYTIRHPERAAIQEYLKAHSIETGIHYPIPLYRQPCYKALNIDPEKFPISEKAAKEVLCLPIYPELTDDQVNTVIDCLYKYFG